jgi:predicted permease
MITLWQDLRFGVRMLLRSPGFTIVAVAALALGIGANSAIFSVISSVLLKPLPYRDPARLVRVYENNPSERFSNFPTSPADFLDYRERSRAFQDFAAYARQDQQYGGEHPERLIGVRVSHGFFRLLGAKPALGRDFTREEETSGGPTVTAIISHNLWRRLLGGDPHVIGRTIRLTDSPMTIVGVMPAGFEQLGGGYRLADGRGVDIWLPFDLLGAPKAVARQRGFHVCNTIARLRPGVTIEAAEAEMNGIARGLEATYPEDKGWQIRLAPLQEDLTGKARPVLLVLAGAVGFVLLIACVNVANLLLARATSREREMALRAALGAARMRLIRQMLTESIVLAVLGGALGLAIAGWGVRVLIQLAPQLPRLETAGVDASVLVFTTVCALLTGLLFGLAPALDSSDTDLSEALKQGAHAASSGHRHNRLRGVFVIAEVALAFVLLTGAGLLLRSFAAIIRVERGFDTRHVITMSSSLSFPKLVGARRYAAFYGRFLENVALLPGVTAAGSSSNLPWSGANDNASFGIEGRPRDPGQHAHYQYVSPDYLRAIGVPLVAGRWLTTADHFDAPRVAVITRTVALRYWPTGEASLGQRIYMGDANTPGKPMTIVGVAGDVKDSPTDAEAQPGLYLPFLQDPTFYNFVAVRAAGDPAVLIAAVRKVAEQMGNDLSIQEVRPLEEVAAAAVSSQRFSLLLVGLFAALALLLAVIGIYGVMAYATSLRGREIAIRIALGAGQMDTLRLLLTQGLWLILAGLVAGGLGAALLTRVLHGILYQVSATDPLTFVMVAAIEATVGVAACLAPARKLLDFDTTAVLRGE